jgi:Protein of unknown function (DUF2723)
MSGRKTAFLCSSYTDVNISRIALICCFISSVALGLYIATLAPTFGWGDSADLALRMIDWSDPTFIGTGRDYVLYRSIGALFQFLPFGDGGTRANFMTAFFGALSVGIVGFFAGFLTQSKLAAIGASFSLAVAHSFWFLSVTAEVYTFSAFLALSAFTSMGIWYRTNKPMYMVIAALFAGLTLSHHAIGLVLTATLGALAVTKAKDIRSISLVVSVFVWTGAATVYWLRIFPRFGHNLPLLETIELGASLNSFYDVSPVREFLKFLAYTFYNFSGLGVLFIFSGIYAAVQKRLYEVLPAGLWAVLLIYAGSTSSIPDKFNIYVLVYPSFSLFVGFGLAFIVEKYSLSLKTSTALAGSLVVFPIFTYATAVGLSRAFMFDLTGAREAPYRDKNLYFLWPPKNGDLGPRKYAEEAVHALDADALLITDYTLWRPLRFLQAVEKQRPDVKIVFVERLFPQGVDNFINEQLKYKPVYLATNNPGRYYQLNRIEKRFKLRQIGSVFRVYHDSDLRI